MAGIVVLGMGPGGSKRLTSEHREAIDGATRVVFRTTVHPGAPELMAEIAATGKAVESFDRLYMEAANFTDLYGEMATRLSFLAHAGEGVLLYIVPGSPLVGEDSVAHLLDMEEMEVSLLPSISFLEEVWNSLGVDPIHGITVVDGADLLREGLLQGGRVLIMQLFSAALFDEVIETLLQEEDVEITVLHHLGLPEERIFSLAGGRRPEEFLPDHLTSVLANIPRGAPAELARLWEVIKVLRVRCPWDAKQDHLSLGRHLLEEAHETLEAIDEVGRSDDDGLQRSMAHLEEELGDLLIQVMFHSNLARETGHFSIEGVAARTREKLIRRHPHVFGGIEVDGAEEVVSNWEAIKAVEKQRASMLEGIPSSLPASARYQKLSRKLRARGRPHLEPEWLESVTEAELTSRFTDLLATMDARGVDVDAVIREECHRLERSILDMESAVE